MHEASLYDENSFITLTYAPEHLPEGGTLVKADFKNFMKRLRKHIRPGKVRYFHCGEYGTELGRPHYHAILFGFKFPDEKLWKVIRKNNVYRSDLLEKIWGLGFCSIGAVTFQSAAYVARYILKKINGKQADKHYEAVDKETGELTKKIPEYITMSLKPGVGAKWFEKFSKDVYPEDFVVMNGKRFKTPRYYDKLLKASEGTEVLDVIKAAREENAKQRVADNTPGRLVVREKVQELKLRRLKRELEDDT